jgi:phosphate transport system protein
MTRQNYEHQLQQLRESVIAMSSMVDKAIARSTDALRSQDLTLAQQVVDDDLEINRSRWQAEEHALLLIATQARHLGGYSHRDRAGAHGGPRRR